MSYVLTPLDNSSFVEQEFDRLDWKLRRGEHEEVQVACQKILSVEDAPAARRSWAHLLLGLIASAHGAHLEALGHFEHATKLPPPLRHRAVAAAAKAKAMVGRADEALAELRGLVEAAPESSYAWEGLGSCLIAQGHEEEGWQALCQALSINPGEQALVSTLVEIGLRTKRHEQLSAALTTYLATEPMALSFRFCLASCRLLVGDVASARDEMQRIVAFAPFSVVEPDVVAAARELLEKLGKGS